MDFTAARKIMVDSQIRPNDVTDPPIVDAFLKVPREAFLPASRQSIAYSELEIPTSETRAMWLPRDIAKMVKALSPRRSDVALVIGAGSGYACAILAELTETVIAIEDTAGAVERLNDRMAELGYDQVVAVERPLAGGFADEAPFDIILVAGMVEQVPETLTDQMADRGRLGAVIKLDDALGRARVYERYGDTVSFREVFEATPPEFVEFRKPRVFTF